jgi:2-oxoglutarate dehydrogenase E1 component
VYNDGYVAEAYEAYRRDPSLVDESWRQFFRFAEQLGGGAPRPADGGATIADASVLRSAAGAAALVAAIRQFGHRAVRIDPLGSEPASAPELEPAFHGITEADLARVPGSAIGFEGCATAAEAIQILRERYASAIGYEFEHLADDEERRWLRQTIERGERARGLTPEEKRAMLARLCEVDGLETFLELAYKGKKRFSIEGTDALVPMLDLVISESARRGAREVAISMAHRGRLNVLAHILDKPYATIFEEFEEKRADTNAADTTGDVKYHLGARATKRTEEGEATVLLVPNPSHLEVVNPVLNGVARARQRQAPPGGGATFDEGSVVPVCIHGDAAFPGEGVVAETFNLSRLRGYRVGGVVHIIVNNQVGFTTDPIDSRSTYYASDLAKGFDAPVLHVNADDPEACVAAVRVAARYREKFRKDVVVDLVGYRRFGHNETDEPAITQPLLYKAIRAHKRPYEVYGERLVREGVLTEADVKAAAQLVRERLQRVHDEFQRGGSAAPRHEPESTESAPPPPPLATAVPLDALRRLNDGLTRLPDGFTPQRAPQSEVNKRRAALAAEDGRVEYGHAESLAFATLAAEGVSVRLTGQDAERGTFAHRMAVLHDVNTGAEYSPLANLDGATGTIEIYNSPLSETAVMGFEYGYSVEEPGTLTLWEAQYGDFVNVGQPIIDQFMVADRAKWGQDSGLVLLLPHGYEGQGPEHSSARLERFLQMCAEGNMNVVYPSTAAQHFHLLRRQAHRDPRRPLVVMTPKSLLRRREATSPVSELVGGRFMPVIDDAAATPAEVRRLVFCTGKMFHDLADVRAKSAAPHVALVRVEELYPWPHAELQAVLERYTGVAEVVWAQEEPRNMGAWSYAEPRLRALVGSQLGVRYVGRADRASPAEGYNSAHQVEQARIVAEALAAPVEAQGGRKSRATAK